MTLGDLQKFLENNVPGVCLPVDLLKIAKSIGYRRNLPRTGTRIAYANSPLTLVVDGECCLDRLYGGFFSDWICGGQWNRMVQFLAVLIQTVQNNNIELAVFFNGALEQQRLGEWAQTQNNRRKHINSVLRHVSNKGTPPPKIWWVAPTGLRTCLRMALRHLGIQVISTMDDHHQEVIAFCRENNYHGLMAEDAEYIIFDPPRYFSSHHLKLTYKGSLETKEFILDEVDKGLNLPRNYFCFLATLLGNYLLTEDDLAGFYATILPGYDKEQTSQEDVIRAVTKFITHSCDVNNLMTIGAQIFGSVSDPRVVKFKESVQYFLNGTKDGFLQYKPLPPGRRELGMSAGQFRPPELHLTNSARESHLDANLYLTRTLRRPSVPSVREEEPEPFKDDDINPKEQRCSPSIPESNSSPHDEPINVPEIVIEPMSQGTNIVSEEHCSFKTKSNHSDESKSNSLASPEVSQKLGQALESRLCEFTVVVTSEDDCNSSPPEDTANEVDNESKRKLSVHSEPDDHDHDSGRGCLGSTASSPGASLLLSSSSSSSNSSAASPYRLTPDVSWASQMHCANNITKADCSNLKNNDSREALATNDFCPVINSSPNNLPQIPHEVTRTASERHQKGLMCPWVYQVINQGEVKFEPCLHDENCREFPNAVLFFRPIRQNIYAILFNYHHYAFMSRKAKEEGQKPLEIPEISVREWVYTKDNPYKNYDLVEGVPIDWAVPTVQRLWFGAIVDDKKRRLRAFLSCLNSDSPLMLHTGYVPQHMIIMATVLRYMVSCCDIPVLKRQEFDSFLITAFSPDLTNTQYLQDMQVPVINSRGAQLASFFMVGVEMAFFANDACGSPIPWLMCCPWLFFDGKLFHSILLKANCSRNLIEVCDGDVDLAEKVNRCRHAILEGLNPEFVSNSGRGGGAGATYPHEPFSSVPSQPSVPIFPNQGYRQDVKNRPIPPPPGMMPGGRPDRMYSRGGKLQVAGVVVGSWGPNFGSTRGMPPNGCMPPPNRARNENPMRLHKFAPRGRPAVLAKRRTIKRKEVRPLQKSRPNALNGYDCDSHDLSEENGLIIESTPNADEDYGHFASDSAVFVDDSNISSFSSHSFNQNSNGLKSPDSGVNVSIVE